MANKGQWTKAIAYSPLIINTLPCMAVTISIEKWTIPAPLHTVQMPKNA